MEKDAFWVRMVWLKHLSAWANKGMLTRQTLTRLANTVWEATALQQEQKYLILMSCDEGSWRAESSLPVYKI